jgi:hypothetical protein
MSIRDLAASHSRLIIAKDGTPATLTSPDGNIYTVPAIVNRSGVQIDANGLPVAGDTTSVTIDLAALADAGITDPDTLKSAGWLCSTTDVTGAPVSGKISIPLPDRTFNRMTFNIKKVA